MDDWTFENYRKEFLLGASSDKEEGNLKERLAKQLARCRIWQHSSLMDGLVIGLMFDDFFF